MWVMVSAVGCAARVEAIGGPDSATVDDPFELRSPPDAGRRTPEVQATNASEATLDDAPAADAPAPSPRPMPSNLADTPAA